jgi:hypothetical protein
MADSNLIYMTPLQENHPLQIAFNAYKESSGYANTRKWALHPEHVDGSLWAAFEAGWQANQRALADVAKFIERRLDEPDAPGPAVR